MVSLKTLLSKGIVLIAINGMSQGNLSDSTNLTKIQQYTPSKLVGKGQFDIKWFNNLYTETRTTFEADRIPRATFLTSTLETYTGLGDSKRWNIGVILKVRSNVAKDRTALDVFRFDGDEGTARSGLTSIAPSIKFVPLNDIANFSIQSSFFIPLVDNETENGVFLDQKSFIWQNRFFYDYNFSNRQWQLFTELNSELSFGKAGNSFANNSINITPGVFLSYFPGPKFTLLVLAQHAQRIDLGNNFSQNYTAVGGGSKFQLTEALNLELLYTNFVRGSNTGLGQTFNLGLRAIF